MTRRLNIVAEAPRELSRVDRDQRRVLRIRDHGEPARGELDQAVRRLALLRLQVEQVERAHVPREAPLVQQRGAAQGVRELQGLPVEVAGHVDVVEPNLPDCSEVAEQRDLARKIVDEADPPVLELLDVLEVPASGEEHLRDEASLGVGRVSVERLEEEREEPRILRRLLLQEARGLHEEGGERRAPLGDVGREGIGLTGERGELREDVLKRELPVPAIVESLLEPRLVGLVAGVGACRHLEVLTRLVDLTEVEERPPVAVVQLPDARRVPVGAQLEPHQPRHHLQVRHPLVDLASVLEREEVLLIELEGPLEALHRARAIEDHALEHAAEVEECFRLGGRITSSRGFGLELVQHRVPVRGLAESCLDALRKFHRGPCASSYFAEFPALGDRGYTTHAAKPATQPDDGLPGTERR